MNALSTAGTHRTKISKRERTKTEKSHSALLIAIAEAKAELDSAASNLNFVSEPMLLDHFMFKAKAAEVRYRYLIAEARSLGIENHAFAEIRYDTRYY